MKTKLYILTYDNQYHINDNLNSLFASDIDNRYLEINIINNHTNLQISEENKKRLNDFGNYKILNNVMQSDWSWGYTTRNWNQSLILGFRSLNNPDCDVVVCAQDDTNYYKDWFKKLQYRHAEGLEFIACGLGDCFCSYTPEAIKTLGLWDERYSFLNWSEHDYFMRASSWLGYKCAIDDQTNPEKNSVCQSHYDFYAFNQEKAWGIAWKPAENEIKQSLRGIRQATGDVLGKKLFEMKWGTHPYDERTKSINNVGNKLVPLIPTFILYPYFEREIPDLQQKGYVTF